MLRGFLGNLIFAIIAQMLCSNDLKFFFNRCDVIPSGPQDLDLEISDLENLDNIKETFEWNEEVIIAVVIAI